MGAKEVKILQHPDNANKVKAVFKELDANGNGVLERDEFTKVAVIMFERREELHLKELIPEFHDESTMEYFANTIFDKIDKNHDGTLSFEEFIQFFKSLESGIFESQTSPELAVGFEITYNYVLPRDQWKHMCAICTLPAMEPCQLTESKDNEEVFCKMCILSEMKIEKLSDAPIKAAPVEFKNILDNMQVRCCFAFNGCDDVFRREDLPPHLMNCIHKKFICPNSTRGCTFTSVEIAEVGEHAHEKCQFQLSKEKSKILVVNSDICTTCYQDHKTSPTTHYHEGSFHGMQWKEFVNKRDAHKLHGTGAADTASFCGRVAVKSASNFGHDAWVCTKASGHAGLQTAKYTTIGAAVFLAVITSPVGGIGIIAAPVIGGAAGLVVGVGGVCGGLLIGAGHAIATPFISLGKVIKSGVTKKSAHSGCLVKWSCCKAEGSWAEGCKSCSK